MLPRKTQQKSVPQPRSQGSPAGRVGENPGNEVDFTGPKGDRARES